MELCTWLIPFLTDELIFHHEGVQTIHITAIRVEDHLLVSAKVQVPGYFHWGFNRIRMDCSFLDCVRDVLMRTFNQMCSTDANTTEILLLLKTIWNSKE